MAAGAEDKPLTEFLAPAKARFRPLDQAAPGGRIVAHLRRPGAGDLVCQTDLRSEIALLEAPRGRPPLFVSYYTPDTPYEALANDLRTSLDRFGLPHRIEPIASRGSWVANTGIKARFVERVWAESDGPICWIDADAAVLRPPGFVAGNPFDIAFVRRRGWEDLSGFLYLNKSDAAGRIVAEWSRLCGLHPQAWDQTMLSLAWYTVAKDHPVSSFWLNAGVFRFPRPAIRDLRDRLFYYPFRRKIRPFIDQKQASRALKAFVNASSAPREERGSDDLTEGFRRALTRYDFSFDARFDAIFTGGTGRP